MYACVFARLHSCLCFCRILFLFMFLFLFTAIRLYEHKLWKLTVRWTPTYISLNASLRRPKHIQLLMHHVHSRACEICRSCLITYSGPYVKLPTLSPTSASGRPKALFVVGPCSALQRMLGQTRMYTYTYVSIYVDTFIYIYIRTYLYNSELTRSPEEAPLL